MESIDGNTREQLQGIEVNEGTVLGSVEMAIKQLELTVRAKAMNTSFETAMKFIEKEAHLQAELRMLLPTAIVELGEKIAAEEAYNSTPNEDIAKLKAQREAYEKILLDLPKDTRVQMDAADMSTNETRRLDMIEGKEYTLDDVNVTGANKQKSGTIPGQIG